MQAAAAFNFKMQSSSTSSFINQHAALLYTIKYMKAEIIRFSKLRSSIIFRHEFPPRAYIAWVEAPEGIKNRTKRKFGDGHHETVFRIPRPPRRGRIE